MTWTKDSKTDCEQAHAHKKVFTESKKKRKKKERRGFLPCVVKNTPPPPPGCVLIDTVGHSITASICPLCCTCFVYQ